MEYILHRYLDTLLNGSKQKGGLKTRHFSEIALGGNIAQGQLQIADFAVPYHRASMCNGMNSI